MLLWPVCARELSLPVQALVPLGCTRRVTMEVERAREERHTRCVASISALGVELFEMPESKQQVHVELLVMRVVREVTGDESVGSATPLMEAGVDSLAATELSNRLRVVTEMPLSPTLMFEHPTPRAIAAHLLEQVREQVQPSMAVLSGRQLQSAGHDRVVLGDVAARWPGGCCTEAALQMMAHSSGDAVSTVPAQRWTLEAAVEVGALSETQKACVMHGGFVARADRFDHRLFGVSRAEAGAMDPQQRLLLECGYEALHGHGGRLAWLLGGGGDVGVFVGIERPDWATVQSAVPELHSSVYTGTGATVSVASGRLSFVLGLQGPCVSVDTACSSALVAAYNGSHAVRSAECISAVAWELA